VGASGFRAWSSASIHSCGVMVIKGQHSKKEAKWDRTGITGRQKCLQKKRRWEGTGTVGELREKDLGERHGAKFMGLDLLRTNRS